MTEITVRAELSAPFCISKLLLCAHEDKHGDEDEHRVPKKAREREYGGEKRTGREGDCDNLADPRCNRRGGDVVEHHGQEGAQHAAAIHGKSGNCIE